MKQLFLAIAAMAAFAFSASAAQIVQVIANTEKPEMLTDGDAATYAGLIQNPGSDYFEIILGLDEDALPEEIEIRLKEKMDGVTMAFSSDIVNWTETAIMAEWFDAEGGGQRLALTPLKKASGKYIRIRMKIAGATVVEVSETSAKYASKQPNKVSDIKIKNIDDHSVEITYKTEFPGKTHVRYGAEEPVMDQVHIVRESATDHRVVLKGLLAGTIYYFQVQTTEDEEKAEVNSFTTSGDPLPIIKKVFLEEPGCDSAKIRLAANKPVKWKLLWGRLEKILPNDLEKAGAKKIESGELFKETTLLIENLTPKKKYYFQAFAEDEKGETIKGDVMGFQAAERNLALGAKVSGTFTEEKTDDKYIQKSQNPIGRVTDGDVNYHTGFAKSGKPATAPQWVEIEMEGVKKVDDIVIVWSDLAVPENYTVKVSADNQNRTTILDVAEGKYPTSAKVWETRSQRGDPLKEIRLKVDSDIRYIRIDIPKGTRIASKFDWVYAILAEVKAIEPEKE